MVTLQLHSKVFKHRSQSSSQFGDHDDIVDIFEINTTVIGWYYLRKLYVVLKSTSQNYLAQTVVPPCLTSNCQGFKKQFQKFLTFDMLTKFRRKNIPSANTREEKSYFRKVWWRHFKRLRRNNFSKGLKSRIIFVYIPIMPLLVTHFANQNDDRRFWSN